MLKWSLMLALLTAVVLSQSAEAQYPSRQKGNRRQIGSPIGGRRPTTSPYLNLLRRNSRGTAFNYYQRVRPEQEFRRQGAALGRSISNLRRDLNDPTRRQQELGSGLKRTGHAVRFMDLGGYFGGQRR